ncbi:hypothetical protein RvY_04083 [Ramazzottius varieornatus]|uniref:NADPH-dependent FMN reductase-like domain-containing protein n=1 Tax=Ramazzottius varieornatus TaxID=947166 RepID=A0A1D1UXB7_RAMVA|nr:hypothetical protein RvY_04083 [Ramazzottius varieornatus]
MDPALWKNPDVFEPVWFLNEAGVIFEPPFLMPLSIGKCTYPKELQLGSVRQPVNFYRRPADAPDVLHQLNKAVQDADAFIVVAAEYNSAISPALCAMMDHFPPLS